jgi:transposase
MSSRFGANLRYNKLGHIIHGGTPMSLNRFVPLNFDVFAGLDVDKPGISVSFLNHQGFIRSLRIPYSSNNLMNYVTNHFPGQKVAFAYESGPTGYGLYDDLTQAGYYCIIACAARIPRVPGIPIKTNRRDSRKIAESLRGGYLNSIHIPAPEYRNLRHLVQLRDVYIKQITANKSRIRMLLLFEGIDLPVPEHTAPWSRAFLKTLEQLPCKDIVRFKLNSLLSNIQYNKEQLLLTMKQIRSFCKENPEITHNINLLVTIPGIGYTSAVEVLARIGDWRMISNVRQIACFLGLVPREDSTGDTVRKGRITGAGSSRTRNKLIQGAWAAVRKDAELNEFYTRISSSGNRDHAKRKAIVAVARKLTTRIFAVLHNQRPYVIRKKIQTDPDTKTNSPQGTARTVIEHNTPSAC